MGALPKKKMFAINSKIDQNTDQRLTPEYTGYVQYKTIIIFFPLPLSDHYRMKEVI